MKDPIGRLRSFGWVRFAFLFVFAFVLSFGQIGSAVAQKKVTVFLDWLAYQPHHMGYFLAREKGWYKAEGLDVRIVPGRGSGQVVQIVAGGRAEFGHGAATALVQAVAKQNAPLKMVGVFYQKDALTFAYFKDIGIKKPSDFEGKRMGMVPGSNTALMWNAFARAAGIDTSKVRIINTEFRTFMTQWAARSFELNGNWLMGSSLQYSFEKRTGRKISFFVVSDYLPLIGHGIIVTHKTLAENPKMVKGFVRASTRAWTYLVKDTKKAVMEASKIMKANTDKAPKLEYIAAAGHVVIPSKVVVPSTKGHPVGWSNPKDWPPMIKLLVKAQSLPRTPTTKELMTNEFIE